MDLSEMPLSKLKLERIKAGAIMVIGLSLCGSAVEEYLRYIHGRRAYTMQILS